MKKVRILLMMVLLAVAGTVSAVPAKQGAVKVQQPDGSTLTLVLHGDEWSNFTTTTDGYTVEKNAQGYYVYAQREQGMLKATAMVAHDASQRQAAEQAFLAGVAKYQQAEMSAEVAHMKQATEAREAAVRAAHRAAAKGNRAAHYDYNNFRGLIILVEWNDKSFSRSDYKTVITNMVNQENYTGYDSETFTGSVHDYFSDNSLGKFQPQFDVVGPYQLNYSQYYPESTTNARDIVNAALDAADPYVNFANYDGDNDGEVDLVFFVVAGNGANYGGNDSRLWWPHRSQVYRKQGNNWYYVYKDGVKFGAYASSVELYGYTQKPSTVRIDGIGTICHEFSHVLGLPDFYDTDYATGGQSAHPGGWSVMAGGSYENYSRTPVGYSLFERWNVGFCDSDPTVISSAGPYTLNPLYQAQQGYRINTPNSDEFFLLENRQKNSFKWDKYLPGSGMLVHRVEGDYERQQSGSVWATNKVNATADHMYYELVRANGVHTSNGAYVESAEDAFPGTKNVTTLSNTSSPANLKTWGGLENSLALTGIKSQNGVISFTATGYDVTKVDITPNVINGLGVGESQQLTAEVTPSFAQTSITWSSDDPKVASVSETGMVTGVGVGTTTIRAMADNFIEGTCQVTVQQIEIYTIGEFKQQTVGTTKMLKLTNAEVLAVKGTTAYIRDETGSIMLSNMNLGLKKNDVVSGSLKAQVAVQNKMPQALGTTETTAAGLTITQGAAAQPREVTIDELTENDYSDYVVVKQVKLKKESKSAWAVNSSDVKKARLLNEFSISMTGFTNYDGKYYDVPAIYATSELSGSVVDALFMMEKPTEVDAPATSIQQVESGASEVESYYNLNGQRVGADYKGLVIKNGKKALMK